jgi:aminocarboxymuconate-semialdehyde decarboxylase
MQHPDAAVAELERVHKLYGFKAVEIGTSIEGAQLAEERFRPLLRRAAELGVFVFAHPYYVGSKAGLEGYYLTNLIGNPLDTTVMLANLMFSGALDELPELKIVLAHGGGFAPYQIGRLVHGHRVRSETHGRSKTSPKELLKRIYFDSLVFEPAALRYLIDLVGADHICIGTDSPFDMQDRDPRGTLAGIPGITAGERTCVSCRTALTLLCEKIP